MKSVERNLIFGGVNPDGARGKWGTIKKAVRDTGASIWTMQETKCNIEGKLQLDGFLTYEHLRCKGEGGGLAVIARQDLNPAFVRDGGEKVEALTIDIHVKTMTISCTTAYGPQESDSLEKKNEFWKYLSEEALRANDSGRGFILQGDLNSWLGPKIIPGDERIQNKNGRLFETFLNENNLTVINSLPICKGLTTRSRMRQGVNIKSILDFYVVCQRVLPSVTEMIIDSDRKHIITNYSKSKNGGKSVDSDHLTTLLKVNLKVSPEKPLKIEIYNFKDREGKEKFKINTTQTNEFSECFMSNKPVDSQANDWMKTLITHCNTAFPKIRIRAKNIKRSEASDLIDERNILLKTETNDSKEVKILDAKIATILEEEGRSKAYKFKKFCDKDSTLNVTKMWKL